MGVSKQQRSKSKLLVALMKLFLADGLVLDPADASYRDQVLKLGKRAEGVVLTYLKAQRGINSRGSFAILKHLRELHNAGTLNAIVQCH